MELKFGNYVSFFFVGLATLGEIINVYTGTMRISAEEIVMFLIVALICSFFLQFLYFMFYFLIIGLIVGGVSFGVVIELHLHLMTSSPILFMSIAMLDIGITSASAFFLARRTWKEAFGSVSQTPRETIIPEEYAWRVEHKERVDEEREQREKEEAYQRGKAEGERAGLRSNKMTREEAYEYLGLTPKATKEQVIQAYRKLSKLIHPDASKLDTNAFMKKLNEARDILENK